MRLRTWQVASKQQASSSRSKQATSTKILKPPETPQLGSVAPWGGRGTIALRWGSPSALDRTFSVRVGPSLAQMGRIRPRPAQAQSGWPKIRETVPNSSGAGASGPRGLPAEVIRWGEVWVAFLPGTVRSSPTLCLRRTKAAPSQSQLRHTVLEPQKWPYLGLDRAHRNSEGGFPLSHTPR